MAQVYVTVLMKHLFFLLNTIFKILPAELRITNNNLLNYLLETKKSRNVFFLGTLRDSKSKNLKIKPQKCANKKTQRISGIRLLLQSRKKFCLLRSEWSNFAKKSRKNKSVIVTETQSATSWQMSRNSLLVIFCKFIGEGKFYCF